MIIEWFITLSPWVGLLLAGSILVLFLCFGVYILNEKGIGLGLTQAAKYIFPTALFVCIALFFLRGYIIEQPLYRAETLLSMPETIIYVNDKEKNIKEDVLKALRERSYSKRRRSQPTQYMIVTIETKKEILKFKLGQDSLDKNLFWVYFPKYKWHSRLCFLKIDAVLLE